MISVPSGLVVVIMLIITIPANFPHQGLAQPANQNSWTRVDLVGTALLLTASFLFVTPLEEAGVRYSWRSAFVITLLTVSGCLWITFLAWERKITTTSGITEPVFPWRFMQSRVCVGLILFALLDSIF